MHTTCRRFLYICAIHIYTLYIPSGMLSELQQYVGEKLPPVHQFTPGPPPFLSPIFYFRSIRWKDSYTEKTTVRIKPTAKSQIGSPRLPSWLAYIIARGMMASWLPFSSSHPNPALFFMGLGFCLCMCNNMHPVSARDRRL